MSEVSLSETMTAMMTAVRNTTGTTNKLSIVDATNLLTSFNGIKVLRIKVALNYFRDNGCYSAIGRLVSNKAGIVANDEPMIIVNMTPVENFTVQIMLTHDNFWMRSFYTDKWSSWKQIGGGN